MRIVYWLMDHPLALLILGALVAATASSVPLLVLGLVLLQCAGICFIRNSRLGCSDQ